MMRNIGGLRIRGWNFAVACGCLWLAACGGKVMYGDDADGGSETGGTGGYGGTGGQVTGGYGGGGYGGTGGQVTGGYGGGGYGGTGGQVITGGYGGGGYGGTGGYGGGGYGGTSGYGGTGGWGGTGGGTQCSLSTGDPACDTCFQYFCEYDCLDVTGEPSTNDYLMCLQGCSNQYCYDNCGQQYPSAAYFMSKFEDCLAAQCPYECGTTPPGDCALTTGNPDCDNCFYATCNSECAVATNEPALMDYIDCYQNCTSQACGDACDAQFPEAVDALNVLTSCIEANCMNECGSMN